MLKRLLHGLLGDRKTRAIQKIQPIVDAISAIYPTLESLSDDELREQVQEIRRSIQAELAPMEEALAADEEAYQQEPEESARQTIGNRIDRQREDLKLRKQQVLDDALPEVFAIVKDTCRRLLGYTYSVRGNEETWNMVPFDVQLIGGIVLHQGKIAEMATGEGKTLVATMPLFLNALLGKGCHLITVNDYLAQRDAEWMMPIFTFHGLTVGINIGGMTPPQKKEAYDCDITYGTNSEFGFDYLRDNMTVQVDNLVQRKHQFTIIDEVDSVLIDEARTPLIISGPVKESTNFYDELKPIIRRLVASQEMLVKRFITDIRSLQSQDEVNGLELGTLLLKVSRAQPKNRSFMKMMKDSELKKLMLDTEAYYMREKKLHTVDEELFFVVEEKQNSVELTDKGNDFVAQKDPSLFILEQLDEIIRRIDEDESLSFDEKASKKEEATTAYFDKNEKLHNIKQLLKAYTLFVKDVEYVVVDNKVMIVDEFTGRMMPGRRFSDGLHQALEAKENVKIEDASQTLATITLQNYFRMYEKLAGMTGTAVTEEAEFLEIYKLPVIEIPTNLPISRIDHNDLIYLTKNDKYKAIIDEIVYWHELGKPVLVGTVSVEVSETLGRLLRRRGIKHNVLNAKYHESEAEIIMRAGEAGAVTIATNMAGRGTDIKLGATVVTQSKESYLACQKGISEELPYGEPRDGLHVIGTERHESRRIDRQLRGRSGRQGDPGTSRFYLSLEDDLMRLFGSERIAPMMTRLGFTEGEPITHPWMTKAVERAQKRVESYNFEIRKQLLKYDEVMNQQREVIYKYRRNVLHGYDLKFEIIDMIKDSMENLIYDFIGDEIYPEDWPVDELLSWIRNNMNVAIDLDAIYNDHLQPDVLVLNIQEAVEKAYASREKEMGEPEMRELERRVLLQVVDELWRDHLHEMDLLKEGIGLRAYGQKDPLIEYKRESFELFQKLIENINREVMRKVFTHYIVSPQNMQEVMARINLNHSETSAFSKMGAQPRQKQLPNTGNQPPKITPRHVDIKVGRNDPCPCGSGKKYKKCCGRIKSE